MAQRKRYPVRRDGVRLALGLALTGLLIFVVAAAVAAVALQSGPDPVLLAVLKTKDEALILQALSAKKESDQLLGLIALLIGPLAGLIGPITAYYFDRKE